MKLVRFLRGATPRPNPEAPWVFERRHVEGGPWHVVDRIGSREGGADWVLSPTVAFDHGDLVRQLSPSREVTGFWVQTLSGLWSAGPVYPRLGDHGGDWEAAWEGPGAKADGLLRASERVDRRRLVLTAADCAETALRYLPKGEMRPGRTLEIARSWARGKASPGEVAVASLSSYAAASDSASVPGASSAIRDSYARAAAAAANAADAVTLPAATAATDAAIMAAAAAAAAAAAGDGAPYTAYLDNTATLRTLSPLVRRWIPLPVLLLARAGEPTPLDPSELARV